MATLKDTLKIDLNTARKTGDKTKVAVLSAVIGAVQTAEKAGKTAVEFDDTKVLETISKLVKQRRETAAIYTEKGVLDRAELETTEADILETYLPKQLTDEELNAYIEAAIGTFDTPTIKDFGAIMKVVTQATKGRADGKRVSEAVRAQLNA